MRYKMDIFSNVTDLIEDVPTAENSNWYRLLAAVQILMILFGLIGNSMNMLAATLDYHLRALTANVFVINLGIADFVVTTITMPFALLGTLYGYAILSEHPLICEVVSTVCTTACVASLSTVVIISVNRYVALLHPHRYSTLFTWRNATSMCLIPWIVGVGWALPLHYGWSRNTFDTRFTMCWFDRDRRYYSYRFVRVLGMELIPILLVLFLYSRMFFFIRRRKRTIETGNDKNAGPSALGSELKKALMRDIRLTKTLFILFLAFLCSWSLLAAVLLFDVDNTWPRALHIVSVTLAHLGSSGLNFFLYSITNANFRRAYRVVLSKVCCSCCPSLVAGNGNLYTTTGGQALTTTAA